MLLDGSEFLILTTYINIKHYSLMQKKKRSTTNSLIFKVKSVFLNLGPVGLNRILCTWYIVCLENSLIFVK